MRTKLADLTEGLESGMWPGVHARQVPFWENVGNVEFRPGSMRKMLGWQNQAIRLVGQTGGLNTSAVNTFAVNVGVIGEFSFESIELGEPIRGIVQQLEGGGSPRVFFGTPEYLYSWEGGSPRAVGGPYIGQVDQDAARPATVWSIQTWGNWLLASNGVDPVALYRGEVFEPLETFPYGTAEVLLRRGPHMLAFGLGEGRSSEFAWCSDDDITDWTPLAENTAGDLLIREMSSEIVAAVPLGDRIVVYGRDEAYLVTYLGTPNIFGVRPLLRGIGALSKNSVVEAGRVHFGLGRQGFWQSDGTQYTYIDDPAVRDYFQRGMNWSQSSKVCAWHNEDTGQVIWYFPWESSTEPNRGLAYDYRRQVWSIFTFGRTSAIPRGVFPYPIAGTETGVLLYHNLGTDAEGEGLESFAQTAPLDLGNPSALKLITMLVLGAEKLTPGGLQVSIGALQRLGEEPSWQGPFTVEQAHAPIYCNVSGRWVVLRFESSEPGVEWSLNTLSLYGAIVGAVV